MSKLFTLVCSAILALALSVSYEASAQSFDEYFADSTLRIDYTFAGQRGDVRITVDRMHATSGWYGRRNHLDSLALQGLGRIVVRSLDGRVLYRHSFSSLFQEWLSTPEAEQVSRSYENVYLIPMPKAPVTIHIEMDDMERKVVGEQVMRFDPKDILVARPKPSSLKVHSLHQGASPKEAIDIVILAEGYTEAEMGSFLRDAERATQELLRYEPYASLKHKFNVIAVESPSVDSGVSLPRQNVWLNTAFGSHFDTFYSERYLTTPNVKALHDALIGIPYEHIVILANTDIYGGGGIFNSYTLSSVHHEWFLPVVVHEIGHSFAGLADEYFYDEDAMVDVYDKRQEPWEQNVTTLVDFEGKKWSSLIPRKTPRPTPPALKDKHAVGLYEGAAYSKQGLYRASYDCRMRTNSYPTFCPACHKALTELINFYTE